MYNEWTRDGCDDVAEEQRLVVSEDRPGTAIARWFCRRHAPKAAIIKTNEANLWTSYHERPHLSARSEICKVL